MFVSQTCILMISYNNKYWVQQQFVYLCGHARYNIYSILTVFECVDVACSACFSKFPPKHVVVCGTKVPSQEELAKTVDLASHCVLCVIFSPWQCIPSDSFSRPLNLLTARYFPIWQFKLYPQTPWDHVPTTRVTSACATNCVKDANPCMHTPRLCTCH